MAAGFLAVGPAQFAVGLVNHADRHVEDFGDQNYEEDADDQDYEEESEELADME